MDLDALGLPDSVQRQMGPDAPGQARMAAARGLLPLTPEQQLSVLFALSGDEDIRLSEAARQSIRELPVERVVNAISIRTHPKVLEALIEFRSRSAELDERIGMLRTTNDRTARIIARRADSELCEKLSRNHERLIITPDVYVDLHANENCSQAILERVEAFLRMQRCLPEVPELRPFLTGEDSPPAAAPAAPQVRDLEAEIEAALSGQQSPALLAAQQSNLDMFDLDSLDKEDELGFGGFDFDLNDPMDDFGWELTTDREDNKPDEEERISIERQLGDMAVGKKIKLAYKGNKEVRSILVRDRNRLVASAVIRSGRCSDGEIANFAGNRNLDKEVIREIANNNEFLRKYPVRVSLVNNPKTPVSVAVGLVKSLQKKDLMQLTRNRGVPSTIQQAANRLYRDKYRS